MDLSIIITTRNRNDDLLKCIASIKKTDLEDLEWEIIVVDDFSSDGTEKLRFENLQLKFGKIIHNTSQQMMVNSRNIGVKQSKGDYILFIDDDNIIDREMVMVLINFCKRNEFYGIVGPSMHYLDTKKKYMDFQKINFFTGKTTGYINQSQKKFCNSDGIPNVFMIKKEVFHKIGYFNEELIQTFTEPDFAFNAKKSGYKCAMVKKAITYHNISLSKKFNPACLGGNFSQKAYCLMRNRTLIVLRYGRTYHKFFYIIIFSWFWPLIYSLLVLRYKRYDLIKMYWMGWIDGIIYFFTGNLKNSLPKLLEKQEL